MTKRIKNYLIYILIRFGLFLYSFVLSSFPDLFVKFVTFVTWKVAKKERRIAVKQLQKHLKCSDEKANEISEDLVQHLANSLKENLDLWIKKGNPLQNVEYAKGAKETFEFHLKSGRGLVFATGHIGNWELMAAKLSSDFKISTIYKSSYDSRLDELVDDFRQSYGINTIRRGDKLLKTHMKNAFDDGQILGILMDQNTSVKSIEVDFFDSPAKTPVGAAEISLENDVPILAGGITKIGKKHVISVENIPKNDYKSSSDSCVKSITQEATKHLENAIKKHPEQWVWFHERWK